jgi:hypothetical protein
MFFASAYKKTGVNTIELKSVPASVTLAAKGERDDYFASSNKSFGKLFRYINENKVSMTTPVEADMETNHMRFYVGEKDLEKDLRDSSKVKVSTSKERLVLAIGLRGSYTKDRFESGKAQLAKWLLENNEYKIEGSYYGVYWNSPFCPGFLKRSEVHVPVSKADE